MDTLSWLNVETLKEHPPHLWLTCKVQIGEKYNFCGENFRRLLVFAAPKDTTPQNFVEKTFVNSHKTMKLAKICGDEK